MIARVIQRPTNTRHAGGSGSGRFRAGSGGFTLVEVAIATTVMIVALSSSLVVFTSGMRTIDTARDTAIAGQVLQTLTEDLRTRTYAEITDVTITPPIPSGTLTGTLQDFDLDQSVTSQHYQSNSFISAGPTAESVLSRFTFTRSITTIKAGMVQITLTATWKGIDGKSHTVSTTSYYADQGLYAYYST
jgi:type II secretory pathway pseudopilin PulG